MEIREAYEPSGLSLGGVAVDEAFVTFMIELLGEGTMNRFRVQACNEFVKWIKEFERFKQDVPAIDKKAKQAFLIHIPNRLNEIYKSLNDKTISELTKSGKFKYKGKIKMTDGKMQFEMNIIQDVFKTVTDKISDHLTTLLKLDELSCFDADFCWRNSGIKTCSANDDPKIPELKTLCSVSKRTWHSCLERGGNPWSCG